MPARACHVANTAVSIYTYAWFARTAAKTLVSSGISLLEVILSLPVN